MSSQDRDEHDPLDDLIEEWGQAYRSIDAPKSGGELEQADAGTRAAIGWMQTAWAELPVPEPVLPQGLRAPQRTWRPLRPALVLVAALLLLALGLWWQRPGSLLERETEAPLSAQAEPAASESQPRAAEVDGVAVAPEPEPEPAVVQVSAGVADNNMEFRSGRVTLVLVTGA